MKRVLLEMMGLTEDRLAQRATEIGKRYVKTWKQGKGKDDAAFPGVLKDLQVLLKDALPKLKKEKTPPGGVDLHDRAQSNLQWLKRVKPERMSKQDFSEVGQIIDDLRMWFG